MSDFLPVVVLPGNMCDERAYAPQYPAFGGRGIHFADLTRDASISAMAKRVLAGAPDRFILYGHSMGGITALEILRQAPDRVAGAILMSTNPVAETDDRRANRMALVAELEARPLGEVVADRLVPHYFHGDRPDLARLAIDMAVSLGASVFRSQAQALMDRCDSEPHLSHIAAPVLLIGGAHDLLVTPERVSTMAAAVPNASLTIVEQAAHFPGLEQPDRVNAAIDAWLAEAFPARPA